MCCMYSLVSFDVLRSETRSPRSPRFNIYLAMIPTAFGLWFDTWNVSGFLIKERAKIYAEQFGVTKPCDVCGEIHVTERSRT